MRSVRRRWRLAAAAATLAVLPMAACTPEDPPSPPTPTSSPTPSMRPEVRDMYEAVGAYYDGIDELNRVLHNGGAKKPTKVMKRTMTGEYLDFMAAVANLENARVEGSIRIDGYSVGAQKANSIPITGCENERNLKVIDTKTGKVITAESTGLRVRTVTAIKGQDGHWRVSKIIDDKYVEPKDWREQSCQGTTERPS